MNKIKQTNVISCYLIANASEKSQPHSSMFTNLLILQRSVINVC